MRKTASKTSKPATTEAPAPAPRHICSSYAELQALPAGTPGWSDGNIRTLLGSAYKTDQPIFAVECECGTIRPLHPQDIPQAKGRCVACTEADRKARRRDRTAAARAAR